MISAQTRSNFGSDPNNPSSRSSSNFSTNLPSKPLVESCIIEPGSSHLDGSNSSGQSSGSQELTIYSCPSKALITIEALPELDVATWSDLFSAYRLSLTGLTSVTQSVYLQQLRLTKRTMSYLLEVLLSNRHPYTVIKVAHRIGMYIPPQQRIGLNAYRFFIHNINYYEHVFDRSSQSVPSLYEMFISQDPVKLLMKFRDDEILQTGYYFNRNFSDRKDMILDFIQRNLATQGRFHLNSNSRRSYSGRAKIITYTQTSLDPTTGSTVGPDQHLLYSAQELIKLVDLRKGVVWKDNYHREVFSRLSLHYLRQQILVKFEQWRHRDSGLQFNGPPELKQILDALEVILSTDLRNDASAYLGYPQISVSF